jgi:hypothetical protein
MKNQTDSDYTPGDCSSKDKTPKSKPKSASKSSLLTQLQSKIISLTLQGNPPKVVAELLNANLPPRDRVTEKQISDKVSRLRRSGEIPKLNVTKTAGGLKATNSDCMVVLFIYLLLIIIYKFIIQSILQFVLFYF